MTSAIFAIGDIHGERMPLNALLAAIERSPLRDVDSRLLFLGDYVDRGPDVAGVIEDMVRLRASDRRAVFLAGNHELGLLDFLDNPAGEHNLLRWGAAETVLSYGVRGFQSIDDPDVRRRIGAELADRMPPAHLDFLRALKLYHLEHGTLFVHAGIRPGLPLERQTVEDFTWIRGPFLDDDRQHPWYVVHGHTPVEAPDIRPNRANIDTGAVFGGPLTCLVVTPGRRFLFDPHGA